MVQKEIDAQALKAMKFAFCYYFQESQLFSADRAWLNAHTLDADEAKERGFTPEGIKARQDAFYKSLVTCSETTDKLSFMILLGGELIDKLRDQYVDRCLWSE